jgi:hypothetical protein
MLAPTTSRRGRGGRRSTARSSMRGMIASSIALQRIGQGAPAWSRPCHGPACGGARALCPALVDPGRAAAVMACRPRSAARISMGFRGACPPRPRAPHRQSALIDQERARTQDPERAAPRRPIRAAAACPSAAVRRADRTGSYSAPKRGWGAARHGGPPRVPSRQFTLAMPWSHPTHRPTLSTSVAFLKCSSSRISPRG